MFAGRATSTVDNTAGANGAAVVHIDFIREKKLFRWIGDAAHAFSQADVGSVGWMLDDQTLTTTSEGGTLSETGIIWEVQLSTPQIILTEI